MTNVFKKYGMAIVAILMIVGFSAFKVAEYSANNDHPQYFELDPVPETIGSPIASEENQIPMPCRTGSVTLCAIWLHEDFLNENGNPIFENLDDLVDLTENVDYKLYKRDF